MRVRVGVEDIEPDSYVAWCFDLPGCYGKGATADDAIMSLRGAVAAYFDWVESRYPSFGCRNHDLDISVEERFTAFQCDGDADYLVNAFFEDDRRPLGYWNVVVGCQLLDWTRRDLLRVLHDVSTERLQEPIPGERQGSLAGILEHVAGAENWYIGQLAQAVDWADLPSDPLARLAQVRKNTLEQLQRLVADGRIMTDRCERWSARKILRRALWHERAHTAQIARLLRPG